MNRKSNRKIGHSAPKTNILALNSKDALLASSSQLKHLLGQKLDHLNHTQNKYIKSRLRMPALKTTTIDDQETTLEAKGLQETDKLTPLDNNIPPRHTYLQRYSQKMVGQASLPKPAPLKDQQAQNMKLRGQISLPKNEQTRGQERRKREKMAGLSETQACSLRRKLRNFKGSSGLLSTSMAMQQKKQRSGYYISDIKSSVSEFRNNQEFMDAHLTHFMESVDTFKLFSCSYLPPKPHKTVELPPSQHPLTLVFDLDQTLVHAQVMDLNGVKQEEEGHIVEIPTEQGNYRVNLKIRPHAQEVLKRLSQKFQIGVLTASQEHYGSRLLNQIDPEGNIFSFKLYRQHCLQMHSRVSHVKDLRVLGNRDLSRVILIDNSPHSYVFQKKNGVPIVSFVCDASDTELLKLQKFLWSLEGTLDVQKSLHEHFRLQDYVRYNSLWKLVQELY